LASTWYSCPQFKNWCRPQPKGNIENILAAEYEAKDAENSWDDQEWVEELYQLWDRYLLQRDPSMADHSPEHRRVWWDAGNSIVLGVDSRSAEEKSK